MLELIIGIVSLLTIVAGWYFSGERTNKTNEANEVKEIDKIIRASKNTKDLINRLSVDERNKLLVKYLRK